MRYVWVLLLLMWPLAASAKIELDYSRAWCAAHGGQAEVVLPNGTRPDCLTKYYAIEMDYAHKFYQAIGQSLLYADETGKRPGIVLIMAPGDERYLQRLQEVIRYYELPIQVWTIPK